MPAAIHRMATVPLRQRLTLGRPSRRDADHRCAAATVGAEPRDRQDLPQSLTQGTPRRQGARAPAAWQAIGTHVRLRRAPPPPACPELCVRRRRGNTTKRRASSPAERFAPHAKPLQQDARLRVASRTQLAGKRGYLPMPNEARTARRTRNRSHRARDVGTAHRFGGVRGPRATTSGRAW